MAPYTVYGFFLLIRSTQKKQDAQWCQKGCVHSYCFNRSYFRLMQLKGFRFMQCSMQITYIFAIFCSKILMLQQVVDFQFVMKLSSNFFQGSYYLQIIIRQLFSTYFSFWSLFHRTGTILSAVREITPMKNINNKCILLEWNYEFLYDLIMSEH